MNSIINEVLDNVKAENELKEKTIQFLKASLSEDNTSNIIEFKRKSKVQFRKLVLIACTFLVTLGLSIAGYATYQMPVAYVSIDINPSVELGINMFDRIVSAEGYNTDGKTVLSACDVRNYDIESAVDRIVEVATEKNFVAKDGSSVISITAETNDQNFADRINSMSNNGVKKAIGRSNYKVTIQIDSVSIGTREEAQKLSISPGKLKLIKKLQQLDSTVTVEQLKNSKVSEIMSTIKTKKVEAKAIEKANKAEEKKKGATVKKNNDKIIKPTPKPKPAQKPKATTKPKKNLKVTPAPEITAIPEVTPEPTPKVKKDKKSNE